MKIIILTEGGQGIGFGHVIRCSALRTAFMSAGFRTEFIIKGDASISGYLKKLPHKIADWQSVGAVKSLAGKGDIAVIDSYLAGLPVYRALADRATHCVYVDDCNRLQYPAGTILNSNAYGEKVKYAKSAGRNFLLGPSYVPMRREFWSVSFRPLRRSVRRVLLVFGGTDFASLTPFVLKFLVARYPYLEKRVIVGQGFSCKEELKRIKDANTTLIYGPGAQKVRDEMLASDCAFTAGGQTLYELARTGLPAAAVCVADNQVDNIASMKRAGALCNIGITADNISEKRLQAAMDRMAPLPVRRRMRNAGRLLVDGRGAERVARHLCAFVLVNSHNSAGKTVKMIKRDNGSV